jgi:hypothetical protein
MSLKCLVGTACSSMLLLMLLPLWVVLCISFRCEMSGGYHVQRFECAYLLEKSIGPLTETMPNHDRSFSMDFLISSNKFNLVLSWYYKRSSFVCCHVVPICIAFAKRWKSKRQCVQVAWRYPFASTWLKHYAHNENLWQF